jgi:hypothetical protein
MHTPHLLTFNCLTAQLKPPKPKVVYLYGTACIYISTLIRHSSYLAGMLVWLSSVKTGSLVFKAKILFDGSVIQARLQTRGISKTQADK